MSLLLWCALVAALLFTGLCLHRLVKQLRDSDYDPAASKRMWNMLLFLRWPKQLLLTDERLSEVDTAERDR